MKKTLFLFACFAVACLCGCDGKDKEDHLTETSVTPGDDDNTNPILPGRFPALKVTVWKLSGIVNVPADTLRELDPKDCAECYTLTFDTDSTASGRAVVNRINVNLANDHNLIGTTKVYESVEDANLFYDMALSVKSYEYEAGELKFFDEDKQNYLLYKIIEQ
ncbi:MAG: hypothetical protein LBK65_02725 [Tannerellaceae bacterium]|jgi:hypothetical protein|nr:hypothetical protein [Tannerellaceae bacterium]